LCTSCYDGHDGIDFSRREDKEDLQVRAAASGVVTLTVTNCSANCCNGGCAQGCGWGNYVLLYHDSRYFTQYAHLSAVSVSQGMSVNAGDILGTMGNTGGSCGTHLHFCLYRDNGNGRWDGGSVDRPVDPYGWSPHGAGPSPIDPWARESGAISHYLWVHDLGPEPSSLDGERGGVISDTLRGIEAQIPAGVFSSTATLELSPDPVAAPSAQLRTTGRSFWLRLLEGIFAPNGPQMARYARLYAEGEPSQPITLTVAYSGTDLLHLDLTQMELARWDEGSQAWQSLPTTIASATHVITAQSYAFGAFDLQAPLLCPQETQEPDDTFYAAQSTSTTGTAVSRLFDIPEDEDWFTFQAHAGGWYEIETRSLAPGVDTILELYDGDGLTLLATDDNGGGGLASRLEWQVPEDASLFVRVRPAAGSIAGCEASYELSVGEIGVSSVTISGATVGIAGVPCPFTATVSPISTSLPISYTWDATEQTLVTHTAGLSDTVSFAWATTGPKTITATATNEGGSVTATLAVNIIALVEGVSISGRTSGVVNVSYPFTATVTPLSATTPITYTWQATGQTPVTHTAGLSDTVAFTWTSPGAKTIIVTATNAAGMVTNTHIISITAPTFAPLVLWIRNFGISAGGWTTQDKYPRTLADVNADARADVVGFFNDGVYVSRSTGTSFLAPSRWIAKFGYSTAAGGWTSQNVYPRMLADVNKDGKADVIGFFSDGVYVSLSTGTAFGSPTRWIAKFGSSAAAGGWSSQDKYPRFVADVNGDGRADIVGFFNDGVYVSRSTGTSFTTPTRWIAGYGYSAGGWTSQDKYPRFVADVNGDGKADVVGFFNDGVYVSLSTGTKFGTPTRWIAGYGYSAGGWTSQNLYPRMLADVNADNKADIIGFGNAGAYVSLSTGSSFCAATLGIAKYGRSATAGGWTSQNTYPRAVADVNHDHKADIMGFAGSGVYVSLCQ